MRRFAFLTIVCVCSASQAGDDAKIAAKIAQAMKELEPRPLKLPAGQYAVADFLAAVEKQTGNAVRDRRSTKNMTGLALEFDKVSFWPALDKFCTLAGCGYSTYGSDGGIALIDGRRHAPHVSYHGITRTSVKRVHVASDLETGTGACVIHLDVAWEPRYQPFYLGVGPVTAVYESRGVGKELKVQAPGRGQLPVAGRAASEIEIHLPAPPRSAPAIASLEGAFKFLGPSKMLTFRFPGIKEDAMLEQEEISVRLNKVKEGPDRWLMEVQIDNPEGTPVFESYQTWLENNRIFLVKGEGDNTPTWLPEPNETVLLETNRKAVIRYAFTAPKGKGKPADWTLVYRTPGRIVELTVPYSFKNVPLP